MTAVCIVDSPGYSKQCEVLAAQLQLPIITNESESPQALKLSYQRDRLQLLAPASLQGSGPVFVDFIAGKLAHRLRFGGGKGQAIAKAVGIKTGETPTVLDATAGLGQDAFILASLGSEVQMIERNPIVAALLADGLRRATLDSDTHSIIKRMQLTTGDSLQLMTIPTKANVDVVYLDPMYPSKKGSALTQKGMQTLRHLLGHTSRTNESALALLNAARKLVRKRVVLKRPTRVEPLSDPKPAFYIPGKTTRYDIWLPD